MLKELFGLGQPGTPFPTNKQEGVAYTKELADGIKFWVKIDGIVVTLTILLWAISTIPAILLGFVTFFAIGCPIIMIFGFSIGCLQYLSLKECYEIVRTKIVA